MSIRLPKDDPLAIGIAKMAHMPADRIEHVIIIVTSDTSIVMLHTACCSDHAREFIAKLASMPPNIQDASPFTGSN